MAVSGLLNDAVGGPSAYPVQPAFLWKEFGFLRPEVGTHALAEAPVLLERLRRGDVAGRAVVVW